MTANDPPTHDEPGVVSDDVRITGADGSPCARLHQQFIEATDRYEKIQRKRDEVVQEAERCQADNRKLASAYRECVEQRLARELEICDRLESDVPFIESTSNYRVNLPRGIKAGLGVGGVSFLMVIVLLIGLEQGWWGGSSAPVDRIAELEQQLEAANAAAAVAIAERDAARRECAEGLMREKLLATDLVNWRRVADGYATVARSRTRSEEWISTALASGWSRSWLPPERDAARAALSHDDTIRRSLPVVPAPETRR